MQPEGVFYKDEGSRAKMLATEVTLPPEVCAALLPVRWQRGGGWGGAARVCILPRVRRPLAGVCGEGLAQQQ